VLEAGVGTGRNLRFYPPDATVTGIDLSRAMLHRAASRRREAVCQLHLCQEDVTTMESIPSGQFDWVISTFLFCVLPDHLQPLALKQFERILKHGGRFRLLEIVYSKDALLRRRQAFLAPFVERVYGARFDRKTLEHIDRASKLSLLGTRFLKHDTYLLIEGRRKD
jgi:ubiquinone/menaquinone biosynthesis C-methylase UbiE